MTLYVSPYRRMANLREAMDRLLEENMASSQATERELTLAVDVVAEDDAFVITALVPGLTADDLNIEVINHTVTIRGEFKELSTADGNGKYITSELPEGRFSRTITLPIALDATKAEASMKNGVLTLRVPKAEAHRPRTIKVNAA